MRLTLIAVVACMVCGGDVGGGSDPGIPVDVGSPADLVAPGGDGGAHDLTAPDLASGRDLASSRDLAMAPPDLAAGADLAIVRDLAIPPDLVQSPDLVAPPDLAVGWHQGGNAGVNCGNAVCKPAMGVCCRNNPFGAGMCVGPNDPCGMNKYFCDNDSDCDM